MTRSCEEHLECKYKDSSTIIYLNTKGTDPTGVSEELISLLKYFENSSSEVAKSSGSERILKLQNNVRKTVEPFGNVNLFTLPEGFFCFGFNTEISEVHKLQQRGFPVAKLFNPTSENKYVFRCRVLNLISSIVMYREIEYLPIIKCSYTVY